MIQRCPSCGVPIKINVKSSLKLADREIEERFPPNWKITEFAGMTFDFVWSRDPDYMMDIVHKLNGVLQAELEDFIKRKQS